MASTRLYAVEKRSPKSSVLRSPMPKSPMMLKSPAPKSPVPYEKYKTKCAYGLISFFHFRRSQYSRMLSHSDRQTVETKRIIDEDKFIDYTVKRKISPAPKHTDDGSNNRQRSPTKSSRRHLRLPRYGCYDISTVVNGAPGSHSVVDQTSKNSDSVATRVEALSDNCKCRGINMVRRDERNEINLHVQMSDTTEAFINQKLMSGKCLSEGRSDQQSKDFFDALEVLNSNKDLFIKLLQDPNSLLVKHIEDLRGSQEKKRQPEPFNEDSLGNDTIVVLMPGQRSLRNHVGNNSSEVRFNYKNMQQSVRPNFFPFNKMKKKLMHAMKVSRKEQDSISTVEDSSMESSVPGTCFDVGDFVAPLENIISEQQSENPKSSSSKESQQNRYDTSPKLRIDASNISTHVQSNDRKRLRRITWDGTNVIPEYDLLPTTSPRRNKDPIPAAHQMRCSPYSNYQMASETKTKSQRNEEGCRESLKHQNEKTLQIIGDNSCSPELDKLPPIMEFHETTSSLDDSRSHVDAKDTEEISQSNYERDAAKTYEERLSLDSDVENQDSVCSGRDNFSTPLSCFRRTDVFCDIEEKAEHSSPVSVLEQFFTEDIVSPLSTKTEPAESSSLITGNEDYFNALVNSSLDLKINSVTSFEGHGSVFKYVVEALQTSGFNWDELSLHCLCLHPSLIHESVLQPSESCNNYRLLFDYVIEVLQEAYQSYIRCAPWVSFINPRIQLVRMADHVVNEATKYVDWNLQFQIHSPTLDELAEKDLDKPETWSDVRIDAQDVVAEMVETVLGELLTQLITTT